VESDRDIGIEDELEPEECNIRLFLAKSPFPRYSRVRRYAS
jgi:hypothetical protein